MAVEVGHKNGFGAVQHYAIFRNYSVIHRVTHKKPWFGKREGNMVSKRDELFAILFLIFVATSRKFYSSLQEEQRTCPTMKCNSSLRKTI